MWWIKRHWGKFLSGHLGFCFKWFHTQHSSASGPGTIGYIVMNVVCGLSLTLPKKRTAQLGHPVPEEYKYGNLALQVGGVSAEAVKYGYGFCGNRIIE
jgi:hypothetical protein